MMSPASKASLINPNSCRAWIFSGRPSWSPPRWQEPHFSFVIKIKQTTKNKSQPKTNKTMKLNHLLPLLCLTTAAAYAAPESFDFKDPKNINNAVFKLDAPLESVNGSANGITGTVSFDPENPGATTGKIVIASESLTVANPLQKEHLHGPNWLDVAKYPEITFEAKSLANVKTDGSTTTADVTGTFSLHGASEDITVPVKFTYLPDKLSARVPSLK